MWNLASEGTTISGIVNESANGSWSFPDGTLSVEMLGGGAELWTITPATGPAYSAALLEGTVTQVTGDLVVTAQNMPLSFSTTAAQEFAFLGLQLGLIEEVPPDGHYQQVPLAEQLWAGKRCNWATVQAAGAFLALLGNGVKCMQTGGLVCAGFVGSGLILFAALENQKQICDNYSN